MDKQILKLLLSYDFYERNQARLRSSLFDDEIRDLYSCIEKAHKKYAKDLSSDDLYAIWQHLNPVATRAEKNEIKDLIDGIDASKDLDQEMASDLIQGLWQRDTGKRIAQLGISISEGDLDALGKVESIIERSKDGFCPDDFGEGTTTDIMALLEDNADQTKWKLNLKSLARIVEGIGPNTFTMVLAPPETGKTAFIVSTIAGPGGFLEQGAKVLYIGNEESTTRTMLRCIQANVGVTKQQVIDNPEAVAARFKRVSDRIDMRDAVDWDLSKVSALIEKTKADIVVLDQADKVQINGSFEAGHLRLRALYTAIRETAKRHGCAIIGVSQASAEAIGSTRVTMNNAEGSKIGKAAELDLCIGLGRIDQDEEDDIVMRYITVSKNKISGLRTTVTCQLQTSISRFTD